MADLDLAGIITRVCQKLRQKFSPIDHDHGNINATGVIANATAVSNNDSIIIGQYLGNKVAKSNIQFGTSQTTFLANNGTWRTPAGSLPTVTSADNGKVLQVVNGAWAASSLPSASGVSF